MTESRAVIEKNIAELRASLGQLDSEADALLVALEQKIARSVARIARGDLTRLRREIEDVLRTVISGINLFEQGTAGGFSPSGVNNTDFIERYRAGEKQVLAEVARAMEKSTRNL